MAISEEALKASPWVESYVNIGAEVDNPQQIDTTKCIWYNLAIQSKTSTQEQKEFVAARNEQIELGLVDMWDIDTSTPLDMKLQNLGEIKEYLSNLPHMKLKYRQAVRDYEECKKEIMAKKKQRENRSRWQIKNEQNKKIVAKRRKKQKKRRRNK